MGIDVDTNATRSAPRWHIHDWPGDPFVAHLIADHLRAPTPADFSTAIAQAARQGRHAVRTTALLPQAAASAALTGFKVIDTMALLRLSVELAFADHLRSLSSGSRCRTMRPWHHRPASVVDRRAFGDEWGNTARSLASIFGATPHSRGRYVRTGGRLTGFMIAGTAGDSGYLQRLAVDPDFQRRGIARSLIIDALKWIVGGTDQPSSKINSVLVNTGINNQTALSLYREFGFEMMPERLVVCEFRLDGAQDTGRQ